MLTTCQYVKTKDGSFPTNEEEHWTIGTLPVSLIHKEFLQEQKEKIKTKKHKTEEELPWM